MYILSCYVEHIVRSNIMYQGNATGNLFEKDKMYLYITSNYHELKCEEILAMKNLEKSSV